MATVHRISEELFDDSFELIALHSTMECHAMAYNLNKAAHLLLRRCEKDLEIDETTHPLYEYKNEAKGEEWYLMGNVVQEVQKANGEGLFGNNTTIKLNYLLNDRKEVNYLLKLFHEQLTNIETVIKAIRTIPRVSMAYQLNVDQLKSKRNLIF